MRKFIATILIIIGIPLNVMAVPCGFITNSDIKHYCYALSEKNSNICNFIQENNIKYMCIAEVDKDSSKCSFINDNDIKYLCEVKALWENC